MPATFTRGIIGLLFIGHGLATQGADLTSGLVAHWKFDETNGVAAADSSGKNYRASLTSFPTDSSQWVRGRIGGALWFNTRGNNDLVITDRPIQFENQDEFTFTFWLRRREGTPAANPHIIVPVSTHWVLWNPGRGIGFHTTTANVDPPVNVWTFYAVVFNRAASSYQVYVDGALAQTDGLAERPEPRAQRWVIGHNNDVNQLGDPWVGGIDDLRIYNRLLADEDVAALYTDAGEISAVAPSLIEHPLGTSKFVGDSYVFSALADGTEPLSYQWKQDGQNIADAVEKTLILTNLTLQSAGTYVVMVSNPQSSATSHPAVLQVAPAPVVDLSAGLIAHWKFDETNGLAAADSSGRGNRVSLGNFADGNSHWVPGRIGGALRFNILENGDPDENRDDLAVTDAAVRFDNQDRFSFSFWLKRANASVLANPHIVVPMSTHWVIWNPGVGIGFHTTARNSNPPIDEWRHYLVTYTRTSSSYSVFVDGIEVQTDAAATRIAPGTQRWVIGHNNDLNHPGDPWFGDIDDLRIYNRVLNARDALALFQFRAEDPLNLSIQRSGDTLTIVWTASGMLQESRQVTGSWTSLPAAASPYPITPSPSPDATFYRLIPR